MIEKEALEIAMTPLPSPEADEEVQPPLVDPPTKKKKSSDVRCNSVSHR